MGKRIIPLFLVPNSEQLPLVSAALLARVQAHDQGIDISRWLLRDRSLDFSLCEETGDLLRRGLQAGGALSNVGLEPEAFRCDRDRRPMPFPGLEAFGDDDADAAIFYGRSLEIGILLQELRAMRATSDHRPFAIIGASGAGKSSLLKAGVIPRLRREVPAWLVLRAFRPGRDPLLEFSSALSKTYKDFGAEVPSGIIRSRLAQAWNTSLESKDSLDGVPLVALKEALEFECAELRRAANRPDATLLLSVDQADELTRSNSPGSDALCAYLNAAIAAQGAWRLIVTIRSDAFAELQADSRLTSLAFRGFDLRVMPVTSFREVIEGPARRYDTHVDPALVDALMTDAPNSDALPLLAFAAQALWDQFASSGALTLVHYDLLGRMSAILTAAAESAVNGIPPGQQQTTPTVVSESTTRASIVRELFVSSLVELNEESSPVRKVARWGDFNLREQEILGSFVEWRLLVHRGQDEQLTLEVAHEALFREWEQLRAWLSEDASRLKTLRDLRTATDAWTRHDCDPDLLTHSGNRLKEAEAIRRDIRFSSQLTELQSEYLRKCRNSQLLGGLRTAGLATYLGVIVSIAVFLEVGAANSINDQSEVLLSGGAHTLEVMRLAYSETLEAVEAQVREIWESVDQSSPDLEQELNRKAGQVPTTESTFVSYVPRSQSNVELLSDGSPHQAATLRAAHRAMLSGNMEISEARRAGNESQQFAVALPVISQNRVMGTFVYEQPVAVMASGVRAKRPLVGWQYAISDEQQQVVAPQGLEGAVPAECQVGSQGPRNVVFANTRFFLWSEKLPGSGWHACAWTQDTRDDNWRPTFYIAAVLLIAIGASVWFFTDIRRQDQTPIRQRHLSSKARAWIRSRTANRSARHPSRPIRRRRSISRRT